MSQEDSLRIALAALTDAADEDRATGGVDLERGLFPIITFATKDGIKHTTDSEVERVYRDLMAGRRNGRGAS
jgi:proteasome beta subunit